MTAILQYLLYLYLCHLMFFMSNYCLLISVFYLYVIQFFMILPAYLEVYFLDQNLLYLKYHIIAITMMIMMTKALNPIE